MPTIASFSNDTGTAGDKVTSDSTLTLTGSAAAGSTVKVLDGGNQIGTATANASGVWTYTTAALSEGNHSLTATATTSAGTSAASAALAVRIDTTAPTAPTMARRRRTAPTASLNLTGTAEANSVVKVFDGTTEIGTATANGSGVWGYTTGTLATGSHNLTARATDAAGNTGAASAVVTASTGTGTSPPPTYRQLRRSRRSRTTAASRGDGITNDSTLTLTGTAAANSTVKVFDGGPRSGPRSANGSGTWNYTTTALADGNHSLTANVTNAYGSTSTIVGACRDDRHRLRRPRRRSVCPRLTPRPYRQRRSRQRSCDPDRHGRGEQHGEVVRRNDADRQHESRRQREPGATPQTPLRMATTASPRKQWMRLAIPALRRRPLTSTLTRIRKRPRPSSSVSGRGRTTRSYFKGTAEPYSQITIYDNGGSKAVATVKAGRDGIWSVTTSSAVSDNVVHRFTATVTDSTGQADSSSGSVVMGTSGDNRLTGTSGNDVFKGNGGHDTFAFAANFGNDVITDFGAGRRSSDVVEFSKTVFDDFADVMAHASQSGQDVVIDAGGGNSLTLKNTSLSSLDRSDFHFV